LWFNEEARLLVMMFLALKKLHNEKCTLAVEENAISREYAFCMRDANEDLRAKGRHVDHLPVFRARNQPDPTAPEDSPAEEKEPDFLWEWYDPYESDPRVCYKYYAIECKRLRKSELRWCREYVVKGIRRFVTAEHAYSRGLPSGAMIGYVQGGDFRQLMHSVNEDTTKNKLPKIIPSGAEWQEGSTTRLDHTLNRPEVKPSPFHLRHLWTDLRVSITPSLRKDAHD